MLPALGENGPASKVVILCGDPSQTPDASFGRNESSESNKKNTLWGQARNRMRWIRPFVNPADKKVHPADGPMKSMLSHFTPSRFQRVRLDLYMLDSLLCICLCCVSGSARQRQVFRIYCSQHDTCGMA